MWALCKSSAQGDKLSRVSSTSLDPDKLPELCRQSCKSYRSILSFNLNSSPTSATRHNNAPARANTDLKHVAPSEPDNLNNRLIFSWLWFTKQNVIGHRLSIRTLAS